MTSARLTLGTLFAPLLLTARAAADHYLYSMLCAGAPAEGSYDGEEEGQGEFDSFVEPAGLVLSSFIEKHIMQHPMYCGGEKLRKKGRPRLFSAVVIFVLLLVPLLLLVMRGWCAQQRTLHWHYVNVALRQCFEQMCAHCSSGWQTEHEQHAFSFSFLFVVLQDDAAG
jgi:hypothetical protein